MLSLLTLFLFFFPVFYFSAEVYTDDGWFKTGDIGAWLSNGSLAIVDRKKNLIKGPHGEYVALEKLEAVYKNSTFLKMVSLFSPYNIACF